MNETQRESEAAIQENKYSFPYHYIPYFPDGKFKQARSLRWGYEYLAYLLFVKEEIIKIEFESLLDVGCGDGRFLYELAKDIKGKKLAGIDFSDRAIGFARVMNPGVSFYCGDLAEPGLVQDKYDVVTLMEVLEHIPIASTNAFLAQIKDTLKPKGTLVVTVPSKNIPLNPKHFQHFDLKALRDCLQPHFEIRECVYLNRTANWMRLVRYLFVNRLFILNEPTLLDAAFRWYRHNMLIAEPPDAGRLCAFCKAAA